MTETFEKLHLPAVLINFWRKHCVASFDATVFVGGSAKKNNRREKKRKEEKLLFFFFLAVVVVVVFAVVRRCCHLFVISS